MMKLSQKNRERAALGVLGAFVGVFAVIVVVYLLFAGRAFNVAAGSINDTLGELEGYVVIVYGEDEEGLADWVAAYEEKRASVLSLDLTDLSRYEEGLIILCGDYRIGVFSVDIYTLRRESAAMVAYFEEYGVDYIVVLAPYSALVDDVAGIDVVISMHDDDPGTSGVVSDRTFYVSVPADDSFGVVLISSSGTVSSKVVSDS